MPQVGELLLIRYFNHFHSKKRIRVCPTILEGGIERLEKFNHACMALKFRVFAKLSNLS